MAKALKLEEAIASLKKVNLVPLVPYPGSNVPWLSRCLRCDNEVSPCLNGIRRGRNISGCKYCAQIKWNKERMLSPTEAKALLKKANLIPLIPYPGRKVPWLSMCKRCKKEVSPLLSSIIKGSAGCKDCGKELGYEKSSLSEIEIVATLRQCGVEPLEVYVKDIRMPWKIACLFCHKKMSMRLSRLREFKGKACANCRSLDRFKLQDREAIAEMLKFGAKPLDPYPGAKAKWRCSCLICEEEVYPRLSQLRGGLNRNPCHFCADKLKWKRKLQKNSEKAIAQMIIAGFTPLVDYPGTERPWLSICNKCKNEVKPRLGDLRKRGSGGCSRCNPSGFKPNNPAIVYLVQKGTILKIGIANTTGQRLLEHKRHGWTLYAQLPCANGYQAIFIEKDILKWFREGLKAPFACVSDEMPQNGWTETISTEYILPEEIWAKVKALAVNSKNFKGIASEKSKISN